MAAVAVVPGTQRVQLKAMTVVGRIGGAAGVGVVEARTVNGVEVHLRHIDLGDVVARDGRPHHAGNCIGPAQLQQVVLGLRRQVLERVEVLVAEALEHDVLLIFVRGGVNVHVLPFHQHHLAQVHDAVLAQRLLVNDQVAVSGKLVAAAILVGEVARPCRGGRDGRACRAAVVLVGVNLPHYVGGVLRAGALGLARELDGTHRAVLEHLEELVVHRHLGGMEADPVGRGVPGQIERTVVFHWRVDGDVQIIQRGHRALVVQVHPHLEVAVVGHRRQGVGAVGAARVAVGVVVLILVEDGAVLAITVQGQSREIHLKEGCDAVFVVRVVQRCRLGHSRRGPHLGVLQGAVAGERSLGDLVVVPVVHLTRELDGHVAVLISIHVLVARGEMRVDLAIGKVDGPQVQIGYGGKFVRRHVDGEVAGSVLTRGIERLQLGQ